MLEGSNAERQCVEMVSLYRCCLGQELRKIAIGTGRRRCHHLQCLPVSLH